MAVVTSKFNFYSLVLCCASLRKLFSKVLGISISCSSIKYDKIAKCALCWSNYIFHSRRRCWYISEISETFVSIWCEVHNGFWRKKVQTAFFCYLHLKNEINLLSLFLNVQTIPGLDYWGEE